MRSLIAIFVVAGCHPLPDGRTAVELERDAEQKRMAAEQARAFVRTQETTRPVPGGMEREMDPAAPGIGYAQGRVGRDEHTAQELEETAKKIRDTAETTCTRVPPSMRASCPVGKLARVETIPRGARLVPTEAPESESWRQKVNCALAQSHVERPSGADACPLLVDGAESRVVDSPAGAYIEITAPDEARAAEVRRRAQGFVAR